MAIQPISERKGQRESTFIEDARRAQIVEGAITVIAEHGYRNASLARIAQHVGISRGLISYHFSGKAELIAQVLVTVYTDAATVMGARVAAGVPDPLAIGMLAAWALVCAVLTVWGYRRDEGRRFT